MKKKNYQVAEGFHQKTHMMASGGPDVLQTHCYTNLLGFDFFGGRAIVGISHVIRT